ncbi:hypothetical protein GGX14DRAFT_624000 [Mycena pura]|uniref:Uncharacterized protein n=1 Tax=Mycena pura TaxID=153505 RepID=A0AAD6YI06_9AGAR|nr:hypothetical protein GGX14DRAFT_624000 [Mycena pura]
MAPRSFTVYCDAPVETTADTDSKSTIGSKPAALVVSTSKATTSSTTPLAFTTDKENIHPVTGERSVVTMASTKKRKTNALATKTIVAKKQKESKEDRPEGKKSRSASSSGAGRKDVKSGRKTVKKSSRRVSPLPKLDEEGSVATDRVMQADIDSRCYELTVSPLADVTQAYDAGFDVDSLLAPFTSEEGVKFRKAASLEPEIRDYFSPSHSSGSSTRVSPPTSGVAETKVFSTPERRHIYSAFTFTSPSPSGERFRKASRSPSPGVPQSTSTTA